MIQFVVVAIIHAVNAREMKQLIVLLVAQMITGPLCKLRIPKVVCAKKVSLKLMARVDVKHAILAV